MCKSKDVKTGCVFIMKVTQRLVCAFLCVCGPEVVFSAPVDLAVSAASNQTITSERPDQPNSVDSNNAGSLNLTDSSTLLSTRALSTTHLSSTSTASDSSLKDFTTAFAKDISTSTSVSTSSAALSTASDIKTTENGSVLSTTTTKKVLSIDPTNSTTTQSSLKITTTTPTLVLSSTTTRKPVVSTALASVAPSISIESTTTFKPSGAKATKTADTTTKSNEGNQLVTTAVATSETKTTEQNSSVTTTPTAADKVSATDLTVPPVIPGTNTTLKTTTRNVVAGSPQPTSDPVTNAITFEVVDPKTFSTSALTSRTPAAAAVAANDSPTTTDTIPGVDSSSGDDISTFMEVSVDKTINFSSTAIPQTAASNTTSFVTSNLVNLTTLTNTTIYMKTTTAKDEMFSTTTSATSSSSSANPVTQGTTTPIQTIPSSVSPGGKRPSGDGVGQENKPVDQGSLTTILLVLCASLLAILLALCVFTYVKFRKKSRSIRKRLTFKDDSIYDNPIYHGRWEVPKAPEPTSSSCPRSLPMLISALPDEVVRLSKDEDTGFHVQFMMLDKLSPNSPRTVSTTDMNTHKNRYRDILPFDHSRVKLTEEGDKSDYINASFVPGVKSEREYIASQGPLERTAADHWRMIWELNIRVIAMLTTCEEGDLIFKSKCCQYWPNKENESVNYDGIYITLVSTTRLCRENYKLKVLHIRKGKDSEPRKVQLFQYIKWPDRKNPEDPEAFLEYRDHVKREMSAVDEQSPLLVHCSAGVGRTGTFIAIDTLLHHMEERESIDVYGLVLRLRKYRVLLVQNSSQYKFVHTCLLITLDKMKKAEVDEDQKKAGLDGSYPYENMVMGQRAVVGELGGLVHGGDGAPTQSSVVQNFLRKTKTNVQPDVEPEDHQCRNSDGMPSPVKVEEWPRPLSDPVPRPVIETPKSKPFNSGTKGDPERALAKELGGMFQGGVERHASPGKTAAIKAFLRNRDLESETAPINSDHNPNTESLVIDNRFREEGEKQTTCL